MAKNETREAPASATTPAQVSADAVIGVYVHIPFCQYRCTYCDFATYAGEDRYMPHYVDLLLKEIDLRADALSGRFVTSIFFGGGTPSRLPVDEVQRIVQRVRERFRLSPNAEITLEANPGTLDAGKLRGLRAAGVNRLSIGVQTLDDDILRRVNRIHDARQAVEAVRQSRSAGFESVSADLIFGLPGQDRANWAETLRGVLAEEPDHISAYGLILESGTPLQSHVLSGVLTLPDDDEAADMYDLARDALASAGYTHYEISNWARPGHLCRHNLLYWQHEPYLGVGLSAHGYLDGSRYANRSGLRSYLTRLGAGALPDGLSGVDWTREGTVGRDHDGLETYAGHSRAHV